MLDRKGYLRGFTLLELLLVVFIIGILAAVAIPRFPGVVRMAKHKEAEAVLGSLRAAQMRHRLEHGDYTDDIADLDITLTTSEYYDYSVLKPGGVGGNIAQAAAKDGTGLSNFRIAENGTISTY